MSSSLRRTTRFLVSTFHGTGQSQIGRRWVRRWISARREPMVTLPSRGGEIAGPSPGRGRHKGDGVSEDAKTRRHRFDEPGDICPTRHVEQHNLVRGGCDLNRGHARHSARFRAAAIRTFGWPFDSIMRRIGTRGREYRIYLMVGLPDPAGGCAADRPPQQDAHDATGNVVLSSAGRRPYSPYCSVRSTRSQENGSSGVLRGRQITP